MKIRACSRNDCKYTDCMYHIIDIEGKQYIKVIDASGHINYEDVENISVLKDMYGCKTCDLFLDELFF